MAVIGFSFNKLLAERTKPAKGKINISNNVIITDAEEGKMSLGSGKKALKVGFKFTSKYEPKVAILEIEGDLVYMAEEKKADELLKQWKKEKKMPKEVMQDLINNVLTKCNVQAIVMSRDISIPTPFPMPKVETLEK